MKSSKRINKVISHINKGREINEKNWTEIERLKAERGISVSYLTIALWVREGKFEVAERKEESRGAVWYIPRSSVENFKKPEIGRPLKSK
ncbi:MAG: hypothetical protein LC768_03535 [Acidobacteria bacterium]|nr:hypothetical protein [Acidobacteriota bacterium]MCA1637399.1 hypothetical protein [Acidobacteriota bacterium]